MEQNKRGRQLHDADIRRDTQVRGSLGTPPSGLQGEDWCEEVVECDNEPGEQVRGRSEKGGGAPSNREDGNRTSER